MSGPFLARSTLADVTLLGDASQRSHGLVAGTLREALGPRHAALLAEPVFAETGGVADWYADVEGRARPLADLAPAAQEAARADLGRLVGDVRDLAERLAASRRPAERRLGEALRNAIEVPGEDCIWVVEPAGKGEDAPPPQPVLVNWARLRDGERTARGTLTALVPRRPAPRSAPVPLPVAAALAAAAPEPAAFVAAAPMAPPRAPPRAPWWGWLVPAGWVALALMLLACLALLLPACGVWGPAFLDRCPAVAVADAGAAPRSASLLGRVERLERTLAAAGRACRPEPPASVADPEGDPVPAAVPEPIPAPEPVPEPVPEREPDELDRRLEREDARRGELEFSLAWNSYADLDFYLTCPGGRTISYSSRTDAACGGSLDVDANVTRLGAVLDPVEHIIYLDPAPGRYRIAVDFFNPSVVPGRHPFTVRVRDGEEAWDFEGVVDGDETGWSMTFDWEG